MQSVSDAVEYDRNLVHLERTVFKSARRSWFIDRDHIMSVAPAISLYIHRALLKVSRAINDTSQ